MAKDHLNIAERGEILPNLVTLVIEHVDEDGPNICIGSVAKLMKVLRS